MANNRACLCCSTKYSYCPSCSRADALKPSWYSQFCSEDCMTLWTTLTRYNMKTVDKKSAKETIKSINLKPVDAYVACVQRDLAAVMAEDPKPKRGKRVEIKPIDEICDIESGVIDEIVAYHESHEVVEKENE